MKTKFLIAVAGLMAAGRVAAWTPAVEAAFRATANGTATFEQRMLAYQNNPTLHAMAESGRISPKDPLFTRNQHSFEGWARGNIASAADRNGLVGSVQPSRPDATIKPYADVDGHLRPARPGGTMTAQDVINVRNQINQSMNTQFRAAGLQPLQNPSAHLRVDAMPVEGISPSEFARAAQHVNDNGGTMYRDPAARGPEAYSRPTAPGQAAPPRPTLVEEARYVSEQQRQIRTHDTTRAQLNEASGMRASQGNTPAVRNITAEAQANAELTGKYETRINASAQRVSPGSVPDVVTTTADGRQLINRGQLASELVANTRGVEAQGAAGATDALRQNTVSRNTQNFIDAAGQASADKPWVRGQANEAIAEVTRNLTQAERGAVIENIRNNPTYGSTPEARNTRAAEVAESMRNNSVADGPDGALNSKNVQNDTLAGRLANAEGLTGKIGAVDSTIGRTLFGVGELGLENSALRANMNTAVGGGMAVVGAVLTTRELGRNVGEYVEGIDRAMDKNTTDVEANEAFEQAENAGWTTAAIGGLGAAAAASPVVVGGTLTGVGAYQGTRYVLENTDLGRRADNAVASGFDAVGQTAAAAADRLRGLVGLSTQGDADAEQVRNRQVAYLNALERGDIVLAPGATIDGLLTSIANNINNPVNFDPNVVKVTPQPPQQPGATGPGGGGANTGGTGGANAGGGTGPGGTNPNDPNNPNGPANPNDPNNPNGPNGPMVNGPGGTGADGNNPGGLKPGDDGYNPGGDTGDVKPGQNVDTGAAGGLADGAQGQGIGNSGQAGSGVGGTAVNTGNVGGDTVGDRDRTRAGHGVLPGGHQTGPGGSMGTGQVTDPFAAGAAAAGQAAGAAAGARGAATSIQGIDQLVGGKPPRGHGGGTNVPGGVGGTGPGGPGTGGTGTGGTGGGGGGTGGGSGTNGTGTAGGGGGTGGGTNVTGGTGGTGTGGTVTVTGTGTAGGGATGAGGTSGATSSGSGGFAAGPQDRVIDGSASLAGRVVTGVKVTVNCDAYGIPDAFQILYNGATIGNSPMSGGARTMTGSAAGNSPQVTVRVISGNDNATMWKWSATVEFQVQ